MNAGRSRGSRRPHLSQVSLDSDNVFGDGYDLQLPETTGDPTSGHALAFTCAV